MNDSDIWMLLNIGCLVGVILTVIAFYIAKLNYNEYDINRDGNVDILDMVEIEKYIKEH